MGVTGLYKHKHGIQGPQKNVGDTMGGLHFTGEAQHAATALKLQVIGTGDIKFQITGPRITEVLREASLSRPRRGIPTR